MAELIFTKLVFWYFAIGRTPKPLGRRAIFRKKITKYRGLHMAWIFWRVRFPLFNYLQNLETLCGKDVTFCLKHFCSDKYLASDGWDKQGNAHRSQCIASVIVVWLYPELIGLHVSANFFKNRWYQHPFSGSRTVSCWRPGRFLQILVGNVTEWLLPCNMAAVMRTTTSLICQGRCKMGVWWQHLVGEIKYGFVSDADK